MIAYPEIPSYRKAPKGLPCIAWYKYDGSNLRWEWSHKRGWYKFGTRHQLFDKNTELYNQAIPLFMGFADDVVKRTVDYLGTKPQRIVCFTEFFGDNSFAGTHVHDEPKRLKLFDVHTFQKGFMPPVVFLKQFDGRPYAAQFVYMGNMNQNVIDYVRFNNELNGSKLVEGIVCKGDGWSAKIKTLDYLEKLKTYKGLIVNEDTY